MLSWIKHFKNNVILYLIVILGFALRLWAAQVDPFLHEWDERYHALVAANMMEHPFKPMLYVTPMGNYEVTAWCCNHVWLHKQPLFMWQMALSMKIFGVSLFSMRLPSVVMGTLLILLLYRVTFIFTQSKPIALMSAALIAFSNFHLQLISGYIGMDHDDVAHGFYVMASIWAYSEYYISKKWYWAVLAGAFSGMAVLNKWLTGLLVFLGWGLHTLWITGKTLLKEKKLAKKEIFCFILGLLACVVVFMPWQLYILTRFPDLARYEYAFSSKHISEVVEGHGGTQNYYFEHLQYLIGRHISYLIPLGIVLTFFYPKIRKDLAIVHLLNLVFVFVFFSYIVQTKIENYLFFMVPLMVVFIAIVVDWIAEKGKKRFLKPILLLPILFFMISHHNINVYLNPNTKNPLRKQHTTNTHIYKNLRKNLPPQTKLVLNANNPENIDIMFFNKGITAYSWPPSEQELKSYVSQKLPIAVFPSRERYPLPLWLVNYPNLHYIKGEFYNY